MKYFTIIFRYLVSVLLITLIVNEYGTQIYKLISIIDLNYVYIIILLSFIQYILSAYRWMYISKITKLNISFYYSLKFYYISSFMNNVLPGGIVGDIYRIYYTSDDNKNILRAGKSLQSVVFERLSGQVMLLVIFILSLSIYFLIDEKYLALLYLLIPSILSFLILKKVIGKFIAENMKKEGILNNFKILFLGPLFWRHTILSFFVIISYIFIYIVSAKSLGLNIDYFTFFIFTPIILFSMTLPVSIGGWGVRETTALLISFLLGLTASASISVSIIYGLLNLLCSLPGFFFFLTLKR